MLADTKKLLRRKRAFLPHLALIVVNLMYGLNFVVAKDVMPTYIGPSGLILVRVAGAVACFWALHTFYPRTQLERKDIPRIIACGFFGVALNQLLFFIGLDMSTPINAAIIMTSNPIIVLCMAAIMLGIPLTIKKSLGMLLGAAGALILIIFTRGGADFSSRVAWGNLWILINSVSYAIFIVLSKPLMARYQPLMVIKWVFLFGLFFILPFGYGEFRAIEWTSFPPDIIWKTAFIVLGVTVVTYLFNIYALKYLDPAVVSMYVYLQPLIAAVYAILAGVDKITPLTVCCTVMIFTGVYMMSVREKKKKKQLVPER